MRTSMPVVPGFLWALAPATLTALSLVIRFRIERDMLFKSLAWVEEYQKRIP